MSGNIYNAKQDEFTRIAGGTLWADSPIGTILAYGGAVAPSGWLLAHGQAISRTTYADLFAVIGTSFGSGDGSTTFNLPDLRGKFAEGTPSGGTVGQSKAPGLPNITGTLGYLKAFTTDTSYYEGVNTATGVFKSSETETTSPAQSAASPSNTTTSDSGLVKFKASDDNSIYGNSNTVQPPAVCVNYIIKAKMVAVPSDFLAKVDETVSEVVKSGSLNLDGTIGPLAGKRFVATFSTPMPDTDYSVVLTMNSTATYWANQQFSLSGKATTGFEFYIWNNEPSATFDANTSKIDWIAKHN